MASKCSLDDVKKTFDKTLWDKGVDYAADNINKARAWFDDGFMKGGVKYLVEKPAQWLLGVEEGSITKYVPRLASVTKAAEAMADINRSLSIANTMAHSQARQLHEYLKLVPDEDNLKLFRALDGDLDPSTLSPKLKDTFNKVKGVIDHWQDKLVESGMLSPEARKDYYVVRLYKKYYDELQNPNSDLRRNIKKLHKRKDLSVEERTMLGQLTDPSIVVPMTILKQRSQLALGKYFQSISEKLGKDEPVDGYFQIPEVDVGGGIKKFGALSGKYVPDEVLRSLYLHEQLRDSIDSGLDLIQKIANDNKLTKITDGIKVNMTAKNPITHAYNILSNLVLGFINGDLGGVARLIYYSKFDRAKFDEIVRRGQEVGIVSEMGFLEGFDHLQIDNAEVAEHPIRAFVLGAFKNAFGMKGSKVGDAVRSAYDWEDKIFKLASLENALRRGMPLEDAGKIARESYVDYTSALPPFWRVVDKTGFAPFIHYTYKSTSAVAYSIVRSPANLMRFALLQAGLVAMGGSSIFSDNDDAFKPEWAKTNHNLFFAKDWVSLGGDNFFNLGRMLPGGKFNFDMFGGDSLLSFGFWGSAFNILQGRNSLGYDIHGKYDDTITKLIRKAEVAAETFLPSYSPIGRYPQRALEVAKGEAKNYYKEKMTQEEFFLRQVGIRRFNVVKEKQGKLDKAKNKLEWKIKQFNKGEIKQSDLQKAREEYYKAYGEIIPQQMRATGFL